MKSGRYASAALCVWLAGCVGAGNANFEPEFIRGPGGGRMSNTNAVKRCEASQPAAACNDLRAKELEKVQAYLDDAYEESPPTTLAKAIVLQEQLEILQARQSNKAFEPKGGRPFSSLGDVPPLPSEQLAQQRRQQQALGDVANALNGISAGVAGGAGTSGQIAQAGRSAPSAGAGGSQGPVYQATGKPGRTCKPREIKPVTADSCPY